MTPIKSVQFEKESIDWKKIEKQVDVDIEEETKEILKNQKGGDK